MSLFPWSSNLVKLSYEPTHCLVSPFWTWPDLNSASLPLHLSKHYWNTAHPVQQRTRVENDRPKLSFGIDAILSDQIGSKSEGSKLNLGVDQIPNNVLQDQQEQEHHSNKQIQSNSNRRKRSWSRAVFSNLQRKGLEKRFQIQKYITKPDRRQLAATLGLTDAQVKVWFQNRRMKWRHSKEKEICQEESFLTNQTSVPTATDCVESEDS